MGTIADTVEVEEHGVEAGLLEDALDLVFGRGQGGAEIAAKFFANFRVRLAVIGDNSERISLRTGGRVRQDQGSEKVWGL